MKTIFNHTWRVIVASILLFFIWGISMSISESIIPSGLKMPDAPEALSAGMLAVVCFLHVLVLYIFVCNTRWRGLNLTLTIFFLVYVIQFFLSIIEAIWFNNALNMPVSGQKFLLLSGFFLSLTFSPLFVWISGKMKPDRDYMVPGINWFELLSKESGIKILVLIVFIYPMLYNLAGYFIAWQFESVRLFYTDSAEIEPFGAMLLENFRSGLYFFQIPRGLIWVLLALPVYYSVRGNYIRKGAIIGLLFATLMNAQHLLPNPYFPVEVSFAHFIETYSSNFIWGFSIAWLLNWHPKKSFSAAR
jgi:hypothetical protein